MKKTLFVALAVWHLALCGFQPLQAQNELALNTPLRVSTIRLPERFRPTRVVASPTALCIVSRTGRTVRFYRKSDYKLTNEVSLLFEPSAVALGPDGKIWLVASGSDRLAVIDPEHKQKPRLAAISGAIKPAQNRHVSSFVFVGATTLLIADENNPELLVVDTETGKVVRQVKTRAPISRLIQAEGKILAGTLANFSFIREEITVPVGVIDVFSPNLELLQSIEVKGAGIMGMAYDSELKRLYSMGRADATINVTAIDLAALTSPQPTVQRQLLKSKPLSDYGYGIDLKLSLDGKKLYAAVGDDWLYVLDSQTLRVAHTSRTGCGAMFVGQADDKVELYVPDSGSNTLSLVFR